MTIDASQYMNGNYAPGGQRQLRGKMKLADTPLYRACKQEDETVEQVLCTLKN